MLIRAIIFCNIAVFLMWKVSVSEGSYIFMAENFLVSWTALLEGRYWTLLTSVFSHSMFWHLLVNMFVLSSFGPILTMALGSWRFFKFYLVAGVVSSFCHSLFSTIILQRPDLPALGASGAVSGVVLVFSLLFPRERILLFGIVPVPALIGAFLFIGLDIWGLLAQSQGHGLPIGHGAHLGGAFTGVVYYFGSLRKRRRAS